MQDKDLFNGVTGKYTDRIDENGVVKRNGVDAENAMKTDILRPRKLFFLVIVVNLFVFFFRFTKPNKNKFMFEKIKF